MRLSPHIEATRSWRLVCVAAFLPFLSIWHHMVFFRPQCLLNPQHVADYTINSVTHLITSNPAVSVAGITCLASYYSAIVWCSIAIYWSYSVSHSLRSPYGLSIFHQWAAYADAPRRPSHALCDIPCGVGTFIYSGYAFIGPLSAPECARDHWAIA